jgi:hypothetical protein
MRGGWVWALGAEDCAGRRQRATEGAEDASPQGLSPSAPSASPVTPSEPCAPSDRTVGDTDMEVF